MSYRAVCGALVLASVAHADGANTAAIPEHADAATMRTKVAQFVDGKHRWAQTAALVTKPYRSEGAHLTAQFVVFNAARQQAAVTAKQTYFTSSFYDRVPLPFSTTPARASNRLLQERFAIAFLLATGPTHTEKLSTLAHDPYAVGALAECASAVADVELAALRASHLPSREAQLVAAARSPQHRAALEEQLAEILREIKPNPAAKSERKQDPLALELRTQIALGQWLAVLPDDDLDLVTKKLKPRLATLPGGARFATDIDSFMALVK